MFGLKKKNLVIAAMLCVVCSAVYLNNRLQGDIAAPVNSEQQGMHAEEDQKENEGKILGEAKLVSGEAKEDGDVEAANLVKGDYFSEARVERQTTRDEAKELLKSMSTDTANSEEVRTKAAEDLQAIASAIEKECNIETLIKAKGFQDCLAVIGENSVSIMIKTEGLSQAELAQVKEIALSETKLPGASIKIVEMK